MHSISFLPHTADVRIKVEADSLEELFLGGAKAINIILRPDFCDEVLKTMNIWHTIEVRSADTTLLLVDFLSEILTLCHLEKVIFCDFEIFMINGTSLKANVHGIPVDGFSEDIKAVTYHEADVHKNDEGKWESIIIVDI